MRKKERRIKKAFDGGNMFVRGGGAGASVGGALRRV